MELGRDLPLAVVDGGIETELIDELCALLWPSGDPDHRCRAVDLRQLSHHRARGAGGA